MTINETQLVKLGRPSATTHDEIIVVARKLFTQQGYAQTSLDQIAGAVGISRTSLFNYFQAKSDLVFGEYDESSARFTEALNARPLTEPVAQSLVEAFRASLTFTQSEREEIAYRWRIVDENPQLNGESTNRLNFQRNQITDFIIQRRGFAQEHLIPSLISGVLMSATYTSSRHWTTFENPENTMAEFVLETIAPLLELYREYLS